jgi:hypothetical protein
MTATSIDRARQYLSQIPPAVSGQAGHNKTFAVACALVNGFALSDQDSLALLVEYNSRCRPPWSERELWHKVQSAAAACHHKPRGYLLGQQTRRASAGPPMRPRIDPATVTEKFLQGFRCSEFEVWDASPIKPPADWRLGGAWIMPFLYWDDEFINLNRDYELGSDGKVKIKGKGEILSRNDWTARLSKEPFEREAGAWIRMNPTRSAGTGHDGAICDVDITSRRFALLECDGVPPHLQLALFAKLPLPIAMILSSGGKSVHAWVCVDATTLDDYRSAVSKMIDLLARFGIDGKNKNVSRYSRLPGAQRKLGASGDGQQRLLYLNPDPKQKAIL